MLLADLGADVLRIDRPDGQSMAAGRTDLLNRGRPSVALNLKEPAAVETVLQLVEKADVLIEGMRPGVAERLGIGPQACHSRNPRLVYGRMTGWGQTGPIAQTAGHDINYIAITGTLHGLGQDVQMPHFPANLLGDFGGGSTYLVVGVLAALLEARASGRGQVVDAAIVDGTANLNTLAFAFLAAGKFTERRRENLLDGGVPYYDVYETADGKHMAVGALEAQFYERFVELLGIRDTAPDRNDASTYDELRRLIADRFRSRPQEHWTTIFEGTDACVSPILSPTEAMKHPHISARGVFALRDGVAQPVPAPRFSRTTATLSRPPADSPGADTIEALSAWGIEDIDALIESGSAIQT